MHFFEFMDFNIETKRQNQGDVTYKANKRCSFNWVL